MRIRRPTNPDHNERSGVVTLEFIIAACLVFITMLAIFQFAFLMLTLQVGHAALIEGTRRGAELHPPLKPLNLDGPDNDIADSIVEFMNEFLAVHCIEIYDPTQDDMGNPVVDNPNFANAQIVIERKNENETVIETVIRGANVNYPTPGYVCTPQGDMPTIDEIRVTLCFPLVDATDPTGCGNPVPDWLGMYGFSLANCVFEVSARMPLE